MAPAEFPYTTPAMIHSKRFARLAERDINKETFVEAWPDAGLIVADGPNDPPPSLTLAPTLSWGKRVVEMDGKLREQFDALDAFIADHFLDLNVAEEAMATPSLHIARMLVDINVPAHEVRRLALGCTPAKLCEIVRHMSVLEMMMGLAKMRVRKTPANQAHVTNRLENPALLAADAAEAALRGFAEIETTVGIARMAPLNALCVLIGSQTGRGGVLTQCAIEESMGLRLAMKGLTSYAETLSVYGTERSFVDGDDTPWSKAFLASAYASRGVKIRFTSGTGSEALMGSSEGKSMLYLEARCLCVARGAGSQGVQNGSISCIALPESLPGGVRAVLAENLIAAMLGLEVASGNDALASHSAIRKSAKLMLQFIPGTDFIFSGYSAVPRRDNMFGGGNFDAEDFDDYNVLQRDMQIDGGLRPVREAEALAARREAARAVQAVYAELGFPEIRDEEVEAAVVAHGSDDMPPRDIVADLAAADRFLEGPQDVRNVIAALHRRGFARVAANLAEMLRQRTLGDYLQPAAIFVSNHEGHDEHEAAFSPNHERTRALSTPDRPMPAPRFRVLSALTDPNDYAGPGTGYRLQGARWQEIIALPQARSPRDFIADRIGVPLQNLHEIGPARPGRFNEVIVCVGPAFGTALTKTINGLDHEDVLKAIFTGVAKEGMVARLIKAYHTSDCAQLGFTASSYSGSGIGIGLQSRGTAVIHKRGMPRLHNLELFSFSPSLTLETFEQIGRNAAKYAKGEVVKPVPVTVDNWARLRLIVKTALLHRRETEEVRDKPPQELFFDWEPDV
ncbi:MAG: glycerol dehydratase large subunit [Candidatus Roseilinea sp.]|nr:MAG: glycerol dehydratase large subunit [Candidatus Roseilinea sp.]